MWSQGSVVDYAPERAVLRSPGCDAQPYLPHVAGRFQSPTERLCPRSRRENVTEAARAREDSSGGHAGQAKAASERVEMVHDYDEFRVCVVEVCQGCSSNHLTVAVLIDDARTCE
ncbi:DUF5318 family protein [Thermoactinospora rubra]|uniref:DUF5318 family protein n=1 Tax=Thermoactinospora rubra TaxID=1088767 RepID=UPI000A117BEC|nr:DUF5318 family protein [Thermoactinospora rubra]